MPAADLNAIFISHATADDAHITRLHDELEAATGRAIWVDHKDIAPGANWQTAIETALHDCPYLIVALSRTSVTRDEVTAEWRAALLYGHKVLPVLLDDLPMTDIPARLRLLQYVDLHADWTGGVARLTAAITGRTDGLTEVPDFAVPLRITGSIPRELSATPLRGRDFDVTTLLTALHDAPLTPVCLIGPGGLGKSRLAAEVVRRHDAPRGVIWQRVSEFSQDYDLYPLLNEHFRLPETTDPRDALAKLRSEPTLIVLDNAEDAPPGDARHAGYVRLVNALLHHRAQVLLTSRLEWEALDPVTRHEPSPLADPDARSLTLDLARLYQVPLTDDQAAALSQAARYHPRLIEWALKQCRKLPLARVLADLRDLQSPRVQEALDEMVLKTVRRLVETDPNGPAAERALKRLVVTRGGLTLDAAAALLAGLPDADPDELLVTLQTWSLVSYDRTKQRYDLPPLVIAAVPPDPDAHRLHYDYYKALAKVHDKKQDYRGLDPESANLETAFEWAMDTGANEDAYWLYNACSTFLANRGRFVQRLDWIERVAARIIPADHAGKGDPTPGDPPGRPYGDDLIATVQNSLGIVYQNHPLGKRRDNLRRAITAYEAALVYWTADTAPLDYAMTQNNLGNAYADLARIEDRAGNLRRAITAYEAALVYRTADAAPLAYAMTQNNLGEAYRHLAGIEDRAGNLRRALAAYEAALVYWTADAAPLDYAGTQNNLGAAYQALSEIEDRAGNLRRAITAYEAALVHYTADAAPLDYAMTQNNLGAAYQNLAEVEDRAGNLRRAIAAYAAALVYWTADAAPLDYALTQNNLGEAYRHLAGIEDRAGNLRRALAAYEAALVYWTADAAPLDYAGTQNNLGNAYTDLARIAASSDDRAGNLRRAIAAYEAALVHYTADAAPLYYALTHNNLGNAYRNLSEIEDRAGNLRRAVAAYEAALVYRTADAAPLDYAQTQWNMGEALNDQGDRAAALACWREAEKYWRLMDQTGWADWMQNRIDEVSGVSGGTDEA